MREWLVSEVKRGSGRAGRRGGAKFGIDELRTALEHYADGVPGGEEKKALAAFQAL